MTSWTDADPDAEAYCLGLLAEEMGEALCHVGRALRFGIDTTGQEGLTEREGLAIELGDVLAAVQFAGMHQLVDWHHVLRRRDTKLLKLTDASQRDSLGRQLAPTP